MDTQTEILPITSSSKTLRFGHTPDPDDAYMFYGLASGQVKIPNVQIQHIITDIETLNKRALKGEIEVTAISTAVYPHINNMYWILPIGASVGRDYGPVVVHRSGDFKPKTKRIGIPGRNTTAYLLLRLYTQDFQPVELPFDQIPYALLRGDVDYGLLIHEAQLTYASLGFEKILDLGSEWMAETGLPIPLGLDVVHKNLGVSHAREVARALKQSILVANLQKDESIAYALKFGRGIQKDLGEKFVGMYVNEDTLDLGSEGEKALNFLFDKAYRAGIYSSPTRVDVLRI